MGWDTGLNKEWEGRKHQDLSLLPDWGHNATCCLILLLPSPSHHNRLYPLKVRARTTPSSSFFCQMFATATRKATNTKNQKTGSTIKRTIDWLIDWLAGLMYSRLASNSLCSWGWLLALLPPLTKCWEYSCVLRIKPRTSRMLGKHFTKWAYNSSPKREHLKHKYFSSMFPKEDIKVWKMKH